MKLSGMAAYIQQKCDEARERGHICKHCGGEIALNAANPNGAYHIVSFMTVCWNGTTYAEL